MTGPTVPIRRAPADWHVHVDGHPIYELIPLTPIEAAYLFTHIAAKDPDARTVEIRKVGRHREASG